MDQPDHQVSKFTSECKDVSALANGGLAGVTITTFTMIAFSGKRSEESEKVRVAKPTVSKYDL